MNTKQKSNYWIDMGLFAGLVVLFYLDLTGVELHQWIGVLGGALVTYHLAVHWNWVKVVSQRFFGRTSGRARGYYLIDAALLAGIAVIIFTGLVISTWLNLALSNFTGWLSVHITVSIFTLCVVVLKLALHWRWIVSTTRSVFAEPVQPAMQPVPVPVPVQPGSRQMSRREFLRVMGVVGVSSFLALSSASASLKMLHDSDNTTSAQEEVSSASTYVGIASSSSSTTNSAACTVRCNHRCSYPGHCQKYTDSNDNGLCDLGECV
jgi:hypothetical protein